jgi:phosphopentomutase
MVNRVILIVLDSVGVGALPDAKAFDDAGASTLSHIFAHRGRLDIPFLCSLGLGKIVNVGCGVVDVVGCYGKMMAQSKSKDTTSGHWEMAGVITANPFPTYPDGFPPDIIAAFEAQIGRKTLGNYARSGTRILEELGQTHIETGYPIVYTSADSVFQIAAHEDLIPLETLYQYCQVARDVLTGDHTVGRVIARPFRGTPGKFERKNAERKDFAVEPPDETLLDMLQKQGLFTVGIGKIGDLFGHRGLSEEIHTQNNRDGVELTLQLMDKYKHKKGLIFVNLVDFDTLFGHRRDVEGYAVALEQFDRHLPQIMKHMSAGDLLIITADHGCDPTFEGHTDHTREYVPLLACGEGVRKDIDLGIRTTFADCGQTIADVLGADKLIYGKSFKDDILDK